MQFRLFGCVGHRFRLSDDLVVVGHRCHGIVALHGFRHFDAHNTPARNKLAKHGFLCHVVERLVPERGVLPHLALRDFARHQVFIALAAESLGIGIGVGHHLLFRPIQRLAEAVEVLEVGHIAYRGQCIPLVVVLNELELGLAGRGVFAEVLTLFDLHHVKFPVLAAAQGQLDVTLIAQNKSGRDALRANHPAAAVILGFLLERNQIILTQLRGRGEVQAFAQQGTGQNRAGIAFLQGGIDCHRRGDAGRKAASAGRVAQSVGDQGLIALGGDCHGELGLLLYLHLIISCHIQYLPFPDNASNRSAGLWCLSHKSGSSG